MPELGPRAAVGQRSRVRFIGAKLRLANHSGQLAHVSLMQYRIARRVVLVEQLQRVQVIVDGRRQGLVHVGLLPRVGLDRLRQAIEVARSARNAH